MTFCLRQASARSEHAELIALKVFLILACRFGAQVMPVILAFPTSTCTCQIELNECARSIKRNVERMRHLTVLQHACVRLLRSFHTLNKAIR